MSSVPSGPGVPSASTSSSDVSFAPTQTSNATSSPPSTNTLYLYTFMVTLMVLFGVSCAIVMRSCILRRRFRRQMQAAIDAGVVVPPSAILAPGMIRVRRRIMVKKPVVHDVWLDESDRCICGGARGRLRDQGLTDALSWRGMTPVSATLVRPSAFGLAESQRGDTTPGPIVLTRQVAAEYFGIDMRTYREIVRDFCVNVRMNSRLVWAALCGRSSSSGNRDGAPNAGTRDIEGALDGQNLTTATGSQQLPSPSPPIPRTPPTTASDTRLTTPNKDLNDLDERNLLVGVLIAMPDPSRPRYTPPSMSLSHPDSEESISITPLSRGKMKAVECPACDMHDAAELPDVVLGVGEIGWTQTLDAGLKGVRKDREGQERDRRVRQEISRLL